MPMDNITIRFAELDDIDRVIEAIKKYWDSEHILAHNKEYFLYVFMREGNVTNMIIAEDDTTGKIVGFRGVIKYSTDDITGSLWFIDPSHRGMLGIKLLRFEKEQLRYQGYFGVGNNPNTADIIYNRLGFSVGKLDCYYRILDIKDYKIAKVIDKHILPISQTIYEIFIIDDFSLFRQIYNLLPIKEQRPFRDIQYYKWRFFEHPYFKYKIYGIYLKDKKVPYGFFVCREVQQYGVKALRIVDYTGKKRYFAEVSSFLQELMDKNFYEYVDCYCFGMPENIMNAAGLLKHTDEDKNIIPNYFEPFFCKNVDIYYSFIGAENVRLFRSDGDQDYPRLYEYHKKRLCLKDGEY
jgi:hypothetical protein